MRFLLRVVFTAISIWLVTLLFQPGIRIEPFQPAALDGAEAGAPVWWATALTTLGVALVFALINATLGNFIRIVAFPLYILTLGIVALFVNALLVMIVVWISDAVGFGLAVDNFWLGMLAAVCIAFLTWLITMLTRPIFKAERQRSK